MRRTFLKAALAATAGLLAAPRVRAAGPAFDAAGFKAAQAAGKPVLVAVHADWCPVCAKQKPILHTLLGEAKFKDMAMFTVDFDAEKDLVKQFGARMQSTLVVYHGTVEKARSTGATDPGVIEALLAQGLA